MSSVVAGAGAAWGRARTLPSLLALLVAMGFVEFVTLVAHRSGQRAADQSLTGIGFAAVLPLAALYVVRQTSDRNNLVEAFADYARAGASRRQLALGQVVVNITICVAVGWLLAGLTVISARGLSGEGAVHDLWASSTVGALAGAAYACWFTLGSRWGRQGRGRTAFLVLDWLLGSATSLIATPFPRGHVRNLMGAEPVLHLSQAGAAAALVVITFFCLALAIWSIPR